MTSPGAVDPTFITSLLSYDSLGDDLTNMFSNLFGTGNDPTTSSVLQSAIQDLENVWENIFGSGNDPTTSSIEQTVISGLTTIWNGIFGTTTPTGSTKLQPTSVANVLGGSSLAADVSTVNSTATSASTTATTANTTATTTSSNLSSTWSWLFGTTSPTSSTNVISTKIANVLGGASLGADLTALGNALFGSATVASTISTAAVPTGIPATKIANVLGGANLGADVSTVSTTATSANSTAGTTSTNLSNTWSWLFGTTSPTGSTPVQSSKIANVLGNGSLGADLSALGTMLFGSATVGSSIAASKITNVLGGSNLGADVSAVNTTAGTAASNATAANTTANTTSTNLSNTWSWLFNTTSPTSSTPVQSTKVANVLGNGSLGADLSALGTFLFGSATVGSSIAPTKLTNVLGGSTLSADLTNLATALFGGTTVTTTSMVAPTSVANVLGNSSLGADVTSAHSLIVTNQGTLATVQSQLNALTTNDTGAAGQKYVEAAQGGTSASWGSMWTTSVTNSNVAPQSQQDIFSMSLPGSSSVDLKVTGLLSGSTTLTNNQVVSVVFYDAAQAMNSGNGPTNTLKGRMNSAGTDYIYARINYNNIQLGYCISGTEQTAWATLTGITVPAGALVELYCGTSAGSRYYQINVNGTSSLAYTESGTSSAMDASHLGGGMDMLASHGGFNALFQAARVKQFTLKDSNVVTTTYGSSARFFRNTTTPTTATVRGSVTPITTAVVNATDYCSSDIVLEAGGLVFYTPGRYLVHAVARFGAAIAYSHTMDLVRNTASGLTIYETGVNFNTASMVGLEGSFEFNAIGDGDNTEAWYCGVDLASGSGSGPTIVGDGTGLSTWLTVTRIA